MADARLRRMLGTIDGRLPRLLRKRLQSARRLAAARPDPPQDRPLVTVVVAACAGRCAGLSRSLASLGAQEHPDLEVLVLLDDLGGPDAEAVRRHVAEDERISLMWSAGDHPSAARDQGAALARGSYLMFLDPGDTVPPSAVRRLVEALETSGSDFAFGRLQEVAGFRRSVHDLAHPAHETLRLGVDLHEFPAAVTDTFDENRAYRTRFWRDAGLVFPRSRTDPPPALRAFGVARGFDVLPDVTYQRSDRGAGRPIGTLVEAMADLDDWLAGQQVIEDFLDREDVADMRQAWAFAVCDIETVPLLDDAERASDEQWARLRAFLTAVRAQMSDATWAEVRAESRVKVWLAVEGHREVLERLALTRLGEFGNRRTEVVRGRVLARFTGLEEVAVPEDCLVMHERETPLRVHLQGARWIGPTRIELHVYAYTAFVDLGNTAPSLAAALVEPGTGRRVPLEVEPLVDLEANVVARHRYQDYSPGAARVVLDVDALPSARDPESVTRWSLSCVLTTRGLVRSGTVTSREERGTAGLLGRPWHAPRRVGDRLVALRAAPSGGVVLTVAAPAPVRTLSCGTEGRAVTGRLSGVPASARLTAAQGDRKVSTALHPSEDGTATFGLSLPPSSPTAPAGRRWTLRLKTAEGSSPLPYPEGLLAGFVPQATTGELALGRGARGELEVHEAVRLLELTGVRLEERRLRITGRWMGAEPEGWQLSLRMARTAMTAIRGSDGPLFTALVPTVWDEWGLGESCVPPGDYEVEVTLTGPTGRTDVRTVLGAELLDQLLVPSLDADFRMTPIRTPRGLAVRLAPPLRDDERGPFAQRVLQEEGASADLGVDQTAVYLQSYTGLSATDSQRAIHDELRRTRPDLRLHWATASSATVVPEGAIPVLMHSREWHRVLRTARYLCNNIEFDRWFTPGPGQRYLQTFHGYPAKSMGIRLWEAKNFTPRRIEMELARTSQNWDLILTPCPEMDEHYRVEYTYGGEIENAGYPRDDALLAPGADQVRARTRRLLGIGASQTAVLYAPTWRDDLATAPRSAQLTKHLDLETATGRLGEEFVFLMRGHRFHAKSMKRTGRTARLIDVTDYPEVNDLILAADAAVLDYSSLRFDFALTGRPMLFLVPDLSSYTGGVRGFLYPFEESAPGPLLEDAEEVIAALQDLPGVVEKYAEEYAAFSRRFNYLQDGQAARRVVQRFFA